MIFFVLGCIWEWNWKTRRWIELDEITEYKELLRDWEYTFGFMGATVIAIALIFALTLISPVYYQHNTLMTQLIFLGLFYVLLCLTHMRCQELRWSISALEQEENKD